MTFLKSQNIELEKYELDSIIPVFKFSENSIGLTLVLWESESNPDINKFLSRIAKSDSLWTLLSRKNFNSEKLRLIETTNRLSLFTNKTLSDSLSYLIGKEFYIYGQNGLCNSKISEILLCLDECLTNFVLLKLEAIDHSIGNPLIATRKKVEIQFSRNLKIEKEFNQFIDSLPVDYTDTVPSIFFGEWNNYYLFYSDNFLWHIDSKSCKFPSRSMVFIRNKYFNIKWKHGLDLFGIPCD
ncbi:MAG: hypothetical protein A2W99_07055 [Bacteroidetes bacterium GWF2_33_16]|nr:MAG: hypothetical protein A2X00_12285 [Bacteroidetes bacterium GWE2_32_14]OFY08327.1 MAG: hypothetical protein A2W99_07055 [Bacteroidetes bacterium GWF2_33_16]